MIPGTSAILRTRSPSLAHNHRSKFNDCQFLRASGKRFSNNFKVQFIFFDKMPLKRTPPNTPVTQNIKGTTSISGTSAGMGSSPDLLFVDEDNNVTTRTKCKLDDCDNTLHFEQLQSLLTASSTKSEI